MSCVTLVKAALARFLFGFHSLVAVWRVVSQEEDSYWKLGIGIIILMLEGLHSLCYRKGTEIQRWKYKTQSPFQIIGCQISKLLQKNNKAQTDDAVGRDDYEDWFVQFGYLISSGFFSVHISVP